MGVQDPLGMLRAGWVTYKGIVGSLVASNVNIFLYHRSIKDMDALVFSDDVTLLQTQMPVQWERCKAIHKTMIATNVNLVTFADGMNGMDSCVQSIRDSMENTSNWSDLTVVPESDKGNHAHTVEERAATSSSDMGAYHDASDAKEESNPMLKWSSSERNGAIPEVPSPSLPEHAATPSSEIMASDDASDTKKASNPTLTWPSPESNGAIPEIPSPSLPARRQIVDIFGSGKRSDLSSKVGRTRLSVEQTEIRFQTVTDAQGRECHYCALAFLTTLAKGQNKRFLSCVIEFDFHSGQSEALSIQSVLPSKTFAKPQGNHLPVSFSTEIGSMIQLSAIPFNSNLSLSGKWCKTFTIDYYSKFETEGSVGSKMIVRMEENKASRCGAPSPDYFAVLLRLPTAERVFKANVKLEAKRSRNGAFAFPDTIKWKEEVTFRENALD